MKKTNFLFVVLGILIAEIALILNQIIGLIFYVVLVGRMLVSLDKDKSIKKSDKLLIVLTIVPILRICEVFFDFDSVTNNLIFYGFMVFLTIFYLVRFSLHDEYDVYRVGLHVLTVLMGLAIILALKLQFNLSGNFVILIFIPFFSYAEELLFRGGIQNLIKDNYNSVYSVLITSVLYTIFSLSYGFPAFIFVFFSSILICLVHNKTNCLVIPLFMNMGMQIVLLSFSNIF